MKKLNKKKKVYRVTNDTYYHRFLFLGIVFAFLFSVLAFRLYYVMIQENKMHQEELVRLTKTEVEGTSAPRGRILDRHGRVLVDNKAMKTIYYKKDKKISTKEEV